MTRLGCSHGFPPLLALQQAQSRPLPHQGGGGLLGTPRVGLLRLVVGYALTPTLSLWEREYAGARVAIPTRARQAAEAPADPLSLWERAGVRACPDALSEVVG